VILPRWIRKTLRPFIPDRVMTRFRLQQQSRQSRNNVDVVLPDGATARRWLAATPDTYRHRTPEMFGTGPAFHRVDAAAAWRHRPDAGTIVVVAADPVMDSVIPGVVRLLGDTDLDAAVLGRCHPPAVVPQRRAEPAVEPLVVAMRSEAWNEIDGPPEGPGALPALLDRFRATGRRYGLMPVPAKPIAARRIDPVAASPVVILSAVPMHDVGGGSRGAQMAVELLRRGYHVTFAALFAADESIDLGLRYVHPQLEQPRMTDFDPAQLAARVGAQPGVVLVEVPAEQSAAAAGGLAGAGFSIVYDLIDDWSDPGLGGPWYRPDLERRIIDESDLVVASAADLGHRLESEFGVAPAVAIVPNAVNPALFTGRQQTPPDDLPSGSGPVLGYHGSLYGEWFDWVALGRLAGDRPDARIVLIGDDGKGHPPMPANVSFLGLKPQSELPAYVQHFSVGLVPFVTSPVTHAVSPLKVYEYLASGVSVAAPPLRTLQGLDGVHTDEDLGAAVTAALAAPAPDGAAARDRHSWGARLTRVFSGLGLELAPVGAPPPHTELRAPRHWTKQERRAR
jgi:hypothetical protein